MKKPSSSVSKGSDPLSSADVLPAGSPEVSAKSGPVVSGPPAPAPAPAPGRCGYDEACPHWGTTPEWRAMHYTDPCDCAQTIRRTPVPHSKQQRKGLK